MIHKLTLFCAICYCIIETVPALRSLVVTTSGPVRGKLNKYKSKEYYSYLAIPYAENPTGVLRFKPPVPRKPWTKVLDATKEGPVCAQMARNYKVHEMNEDCLYINIHVPLTESQMFLPVVVVIHGGALQFLSGNSDYIYGPQLLLERNVIVIGINYRLGPLGFLSLDISEASGNAALKDILLCLKWIQQNIINFGGNANNVTLIGHSSGAAVIHYLLLTKKSEGLFQQVVLLSGSALSPRAYSRHPKEVTLALARELGIKTNNVSEILTHLQEMDVQELLKGCYNLGKYDDSVFREFAAFVPSKEIESSHAVMTVDPVLFFRKNNKLPINVTIMAGITAQEGVSLIPKIIRSPKTIIKLREYPENCIPSNIEYPLNSQKSKRLGKSIAKFYFGGEQNNRWINVTDAITKLVSDVQYMYGIHYWIKQFKSRVYSSTLYYYVFDFEGDLNWSKKNYKINWPGTAHSDEMGYIFLTNATKSIIGTADARSLRMVNTVLNLLSNFIFYGNPTPDDRSHIKWLDYGREGNYLLIGDKMSVNTFSTCELNNRMQYWENVYKEYYEYVDKDGELQYKIYP